MTEGNLPNEPHRGIFFKADCPNKNLGACAAGTSKTAKEAIINARFRSGEIVFIDPNCQYGKPGQG